MGPWAIPAAVATIAGIVLAVGAIGKITAHATGGLISQPTLALMGEAGENEVVAPEHSFLDYSKTVFSMGANLASNLAGHDRQVMGYQASGASAYDSTRLSRRTPAGTEADSGPVHNYAGATIIAVNSRQWEDLVAKGHQGYQKRKS